MEGEAKQRIRHAVERGEHEVDLGYLGLTKLPLIPNSITELKLNDNTLAKLPDWISDLTNLIHLDISGNGLTELPDQIENLVNLENLDFSLNELTRVPDWIGSLTRLNSLNISHNALTELPSQIGNLSNLTRLNIASNALTELPDWIGNLTDLTSLDISGNALTELPDWIGNLTHLTHLGFALSGSTELPDWIGDLTDLTSLDISSNALTELPDWIGNLTHLTDLDISGNALTELPAQLGYLTKLRELNLGNNALTELPDWIGDLTNLTKLNLTQNELVGLPNRLARLTNLETLYLGHNEMKEVPSCLANLFNLMYLYMHYNRLTKVPEWIENLENLLVVTFSNNHLTQIPTKVSNLAQLIRLDIGGNELADVPGWIKDLPDLADLGLSDVGLTELPEWIAGLAKLTELDVSENRLTELPTWISGLTCLTKLNLAGNKLTRLPENIINLVELKHLYVHENPLISPPIDVCRAGVEETFAVLRELGLNGIEEWSSRMLVVGEAAVGKTSVTKALCNLPYDPSEPQTHGVHVDPLLLDHPERASIQMQLNVWDFGGQLEYRATQRFYLTDRSLFILVWNTRRGSRATGGRVEEWLQAITAVAPTSPVIVVATHATEYVSDLDEEDLRRRFPQIAAFSQVDCADHSGISELRETIRRLTASLPLMGVRWPASWVEAAHRLTEYPERVITVGKADEVMTQLSLTKVDIRQTIRRVLHDRGDILHFQEDPELADRVVLQPAWVDQMITRVLDSDPLARAGGILSRTHRRELWRDLDDPGLEEMLTVLMERFDLAYRLDSADHSDVALVVERLPSGKPARWPDAWQSVRQDPDLTELRLTYKLSSRQAGIPSWFIAREHRFTTGTAWAHGVLLKHRGQVDPAWALLTDDGQPRPTLRLIVRGHQPHTFYSLLDEGFTGIIADRYPGLEIRRFVPCPCSINQTTPCEHEFDYSAAQRALQRGVLLQCQQSFEQIDPRTLLLGLRPFSLESELGHLSRGLHDLQLSANRIENSQLQILDCIRDLLRYRGEQATHCPSIFTITPTSRSGAGVRKYRLQLFCEQPDGPHPLADGAGSYIITSVPRWLRDYAPYLKTILTALRYAMPILSPALVGIAGLPLPVTTKADLELSCKLLEGLDELTSEEISRDTARRVLQPTDFRQLRQALLQIDPDFGGLRERQLPENRGIAYLCPTHREALRYPQTAYTGR